MARGVDLRERGKGVDKLMSDQHVANCALVHRVSK